MTIRENNEITIAGGGLVGSLLAILLAKQGKQVTIYEKRPDPRVKGYQEGRSINLALSHRGWQALEQAGIAERIRPIVLPMRGRMIHDPKGQTIFQPYGTEQQAIYSVSRKQLNRALLEAAAEIPTVKLRFEHRIAEVDLVETELFLEKEGEPRQIQAFSNVLIGADGAFSKIRLAMQRTDRFNYSQSFIDHGYKELCIPPLPNGQHAMNPNALHIWPRKSFMLIALPNLDGSFTATLFLPYKGDSASFEQLTDDRSVTEFFLEAFPDVVEYMPRLLHDFRLNPVSSLITVQCSPWIRNRTLLIGDAAHSIVPFYGQGMNAGFEDCVVLAQCLERFGRDWPAAMEAFQTARIPNANAIAEMALDNFIEMRDKVADPDFLLRKKIDARLHQLLPQQWIPQYTMVTFSSIPYATAQKIGRMQQTVLDKLLSRPEVRKNWDSLDLASYPEVLAFVGEPEVAAE